VNEQLSLVLRPAWEWEDAEDDFEEHEVGDFWASRAGRIALGLEPAEAVE
jgi:hypothetical protein